MNRKIVFTIVLLAVLFCNCFTLAQSPEINSIDSLVDKVCGKFNVPGMAVGIVKDGKVLLAKGFGKKEMGKPEPIDEHTLFGIASNSKAFTATALAILVEEGKIKWDSPVVEYLPWFKLSNPYVTSEITVRDLLVHRSGLSLGEGDLLLWPSTEYTRKEICRRLQYLPLVTSFRSAYAYDNVLYLVAGELIEAVSGITWEEFVKKNILEKIGMEDTKVSPDEAFKTPNIARPHQMVEGRLMSVEPFTCSNSNPAGGITTSVTDMCKWLMVQLDSGRISAEQRLFKPQTTKQLWQIVTPMPIPNYQGELSSLKPNFYGYALGFQLKDYCGYKLVTHTGAYTGFYSQVMMVPSLKLGIVVLTNQESGYAFNSVTYSILDEFLKIPHKDWLAAYSKKAQQDDEEVEADLKSQGGNRNVDSKPSLPVKAYAGIYRDKWYGDMEIKLDGEKLEIQFLKTKELVGEMTHWQYNTFVVKWYKRELLADAFVTFNLTPEGKIDEVKMKPVSKATDFSYDFQDLLFKPVIK